MSELKAVIQAGGRGTRLAPYSTVLPKALMPVGEGTVIDHLLNRFRDAGVSEVIITVSRFGPLIRSYCGDGSRWNLNIEYITEDAPLGTIGALNLLRDRLDGPFFVTNSDVYTDLELKDLLATHSNGSASLTVVVTPQTVNISYGVVDHADGLVTDFREKPSQQLSVSTGIYCMSPSVFAYIPPTGAFGFDHLLAAMLGRGAAVGVHEHLGSWIDIGRVEDLRKAQEQAAHPFVPDEVV
ncbi:MAG: NDP-mannose synthase [Pseudonocardiales bacterium]|nr:NDP-mannose synthase [Pseudonocardiales bacterium]MDT7577801.1 NDP-mannose synthase [Pseudonocardiales bacterium]